MLGPMWVAFGEALFPNIDLRRHVRSRRCLPKLENLGHTVREYFGPSSLGCLR